MKSDNNIGLIIAEGIMGNIAANAGAIYQGAKDFLTKKTIPEMGSSIANKLKKIWNSKKVQKTISGVKKGATETGKYLKDIGDDISSGYRGITGDPNYIKNKLN